MVKRKYKFPERRRLRAGFKKYMRKKKIDCRLKKNRGKAVCRRKMRRKR